MYYRLLKGSGHNFYHTRSVHHTLVQHNRAPCLLQRGVTPLQASSPRHKAAINWNWSQNVSEGPCPGLLDRGFNSWNIQGTAGPSDFVFIGPFKQLTPCKLGVAKVHPLLLAWLASGPSKRILLDSSWGGYKVVILHLHCLLLGYMILPAKCLARFRVSFPLLALWSSPSLLHRPQLHSKPREGVGSAAVGQTLGRSHALSPHPPRLTIPRWDQEKKVESFCIWDSGVCAC